MKRRISVIGPEPTGFSFLKASGSATSFQICSGTTGKSAIDSGKCVSTSFSVIFTSVGDGASTEATLSPTPTMSTAGFFSISSSVYFMSAEVSGWPSDHLTPSRSV